MAAGSAAAPPSARHRAPGPAAPEPASRGRGRRAGRTVTAAVPAPEAASGVHPVEGPARPTRGARFRAGFSEGTPGPQGAWGRRLSLGVRGDGGRRRWGRYPSATRRCPKPAAELGGGGGRWGKPHFVPPPRPPRVIGSRPGLLLLDVPRDSGSPAPTEPPSPHRTRSFPPELAARCVPFPLPPRREIETSSSVFRVRGAHVWEPQKCNYFVENRWFAGLAQLDPLR